MHVEQGDWEVLLRSACLEVSAGRAGSRPALGRGWQNGLGLRGRRAVGPQLMPLTPLYSRPAGWPSHTQHYYPVCCCHTVVSGACRFHELLSDGPF